MQKRRLEQIDQLRNVADQAIQKAEWYAQRGDKKWAGFYRDQAILANRMRYELIQREERKQKALDALARSRATIDSEFKEVA